MGYPPSYKVHYKNALEMQNCSSQGLALWTSHQPNAHSSPTQTTDRQKHGTCDVVQRQKQTGGVLCNKPS
jgi:hypothetical protein